MEKTMKAAIYSSPGIVETVTRAVPTPGEGEILIKVEATGICGTDLAILAGKHPRAKAPLIMGHEVGGLVEQIGGNISAGFAVGDRVTFFPLISCGVCSTCRDGNTYVCENLKLIGIDADGGMADYITVPTASVVPVPSGWSGSTAAVIEPAAVAVHSIRKSSVKAGDNVLVLGAGIIGNLCGQAAHAAGAARVVIGDIVPFRLEAAKKCGMEPVNLAVDTLDAAVSDVTDGRGFDVVLECSGSAPAHALAPSVTSVLGEVLVVGMPKQPVSVDMRLVAFKELRYTGTRVYELRDFARAVELVERGRLKVDGLVSHTMPVDKAVEAFVLAQEPAQALKVLITF